MLIRVVFRLGKQTLTRPADVDLDFLPDSFEEMPAVITGRVVWEPEDMGLIELSETKQAVFNTTQVLYDIELKGDNDPFHFTPRRHGYPIRRV